MKISGDAQVLLRVEPVQETVLNTRFPPKTENQSDFRTEDGVQTRNLKSGENELRADLMRAKIIAKLR